MDLASPTMVFVFFCSSRAFWISRFWRRLKFFTVVSSRGNVWAWTKKGMSQEIRLIKASFPTAFIFSLISYRDSRRPLHPAPRDGASPSTRLWRLIGIYKLYIHFVRNKFFIMGHVQKQLHGFFAIGFIIQCTLVYIHSYKCVGGFGA